jgi:hypothetical protein
MAAKADISSTTITYAESINAEVATEPMERSNPSTTRVAVTPSAKIPVIETDWKIKTADRGPANPSATMENNKTKPNSNKRKPYRIAKPVKLIILLYPFKLPLFIATSPADFPLYRDRISTMLDSLFSKIPAYEPSCKTTILSAISTASSSSDTKTNVALSRDDCLI